MLTHMLDTNIVIYILRKKPEEIIQPLELHADQLCISSVTLMELFYGIERSSYKATNRIAVEGFTARVSVVPYANEAAMYTAQIMGDLASKGTPIGPYDAMIAGAARAQGFVLVTNNTREFERVDGLRVDNWLNQGEG